MKYEIFEIISKYGKRKLSQGIYYDDKYETYQLKFENKEAAINTIQHMKTVGGYEAYKFTILEVY